MARFADPAGAEFRVWQPAGHHGAQLVNEAGAWNWSELNTPDPDGAKEFYGQVFGWETANTDMNGYDYTMWLMPGYDPRDRGDVDVPVEVIGGITPIEQGRAHWGVAFIVDDTDAVAQTAVRLGGGVIAAPFDVGIVRIAVLADPHGATFSVNQLRTTDYGLRTGANRQHRRQAPRRLEPSAARVA
jgi:predicted enzyme related to lactoylglutathione lyase